ncbi:MAG TPA: hypothetical protein VII08_10890 [Myxococcales bacterium]
MEKRIWKGTKGSYSIQSEKKADGRIRAEAWGPLGASGKAQSNERFTWKEAESEEQAEELLIAELQRRNA